METQKNSFTKFFSKNFKEKRMLWKGPSATPSAIPEATPEGQEGQGAMAEEVKALELELKKQASNLQETAGAIVGRDYSQDLRNFVTQTSKDITEQLNRVEKIVDLEGMKAKIEEFGGDIKIIVERTKIEDMKKQAEKVKEFIGNVMGDLPDEVKTKIGEMVASAGEVFSGQLEQAEEALKRTLPTNVEEAIAMAERAVEEVERFMGEVKARVESIANKIRMILFTKGGPDHTYYTKALKEIIVEAINIFSLDIMTVPIEQFDNAMEQLMEERKNDVAIAYAADTLGETPEMIKKAIVFFEAGISDIEEDSMTPEQKASIEIIKKIMEHEELKNMFNVRITGSTDAEKWRKQNPEIEAGKDLYKRMHASLGEITSLLASGRIEPADYLTDAQKALVAQVVAIDINSDEGIKQMHELVEANKQEFRGSANSLFNKAQALQRAQSLARKVGNEDTVFNLENSDKRSAEGRFARAEVVFTGIPEASEERVKLVEGLQEQVKNLSEIAGKVLEDKIYSFLETKVTKLNDKIVDQLNSISEHTDPKQLEAKIREFQREIEEIKRRMEEEGEARREKTGGGFPFESDEATREAEDKAATRVAEKEMWRLEAEAREAADVADTRVAEKEMWRLEDEAREAVMVAEAVKTKEDMTRFLTTLLDRLKTLGEGVLDRPERTTIIARLKVRIEEQLEKLKTIGKKVPKSILAEVKRIIKEFKEQVDFVKLPRSWGRSEVEEERDVSFGERVKETAGKVVSGVREGMENMRRTIEQAKKNMGAEKIEATADGRLAFYEDGKLKTGKVIFPDGTTIEGDFNKYLQLVQGGKIVSPEGERIVLTRSMNVDNKAKDILRTLPLAVIPFIGPQLVAAYRRLKREI